MKIIHSFIKCIHCGKKIEVLDGDVFFYVDKNDHHWKTELDCPYCGYTNEFEDKRLEMWEEEF